MNRRASAILHLLFLLGALGCRDAGACPADMPTVDISPPFVDVFTDFAVLEDRTSQMTIADLTQSGVSFIPAPVANLPRGYKQGAYWFCLLLRNGTAETRKRWLTIGTPSLQLAELYQPTGDAWQMMRAGTWVPNAQKTVVTGHAVFPLVFQPGETKAMLLRVQSETVFNSMAAVWEPEAFLQRTSQKNLQRTLVLGGLLVAAAISLIVSWHLRQTAYVWFALVLICSSLLETLRSGLLQQYVWPDQWPFYTPITTTLGGLEIICLTKFIDQTLDIPVKFPLFNKIFKGIRLLGISGILGSFLHYQSGARVISWIGIGLLPVLLAVLILAWRKNLRQAKFFLPSILLWGLEETFRLLTNLGLLPATPGMIEFDANSALLIATPMIFFGLVEHTHQLSRELFASHAVSRAKSELLARVSHDLRAPLHTIIGYARLLRRGLRRLSIEQAAQSIEISGKDLLGLIDELLDEARLQTGRLAIHPVPTDLMPWLEELCRSATRQCQRNGNVFTFDTDSHLPHRVCLDGARLRQVFDNLIQNANDHTENGKLHLHCRTLNLDSRVRFFFALQDSGKGIEPADQARIFEPFVSIRALHPERPPAGLGLGLSISRELIHLMGGEISVVSAPGAGSRFLFSIECDLPREPAP